LNSVFNFVSRIKNPLVGVPRRRLLAQVDEFCRQRGLEDYRLLVRKGALVAQDPTGYEDIIGDEALTADEIESLRNEVLHKWRIPRTLFLTVITCSLGAAVQGWDQTGSNGANLFFPQALGIGSNSIHDKVLVGLVNSGPYIGTAFFGCWMSDPLNNLLGRRGTIFFAANFCLWPVLGSAFCNTWEQLLACRVLLGIGMGTKASTGESASRAFIRLFSSAALQAYFNDFSRWTCSVADQNAQYPSLQLRTVRHIFVERSS
jgi:hypothetical protein